MVAEEAKEKEEDTKQLVCSVFRSFSSITRNCLSTRQDFEHRVGHSLLLQLVTNITPPSEVVLKHALDMVSSTHPSAKPLPLIQPLPPLLLCRWWRGSTGIEVKITPSSTCLPARCCFTGCPPCNSPCSCGWPSDCTTCAATAPTTSNDVALPASSPRYSKSSLSHKHRITSSHNRWKVSHALQQSFFCLFTIFVYCFIWLFIVCIVCLLFHSCLFFLFCLLFLDLLIDTLEVLGTHSIRTGELKQLIGALRPLENGTLVC